MRVCLVCEGGYPYITGGVSGWVQMLCSGTPDVEFVIWSIATTPEEMSEYKYELPENVKEVKTVYLGEEPSKQNYKNIHISEREKKVLRKFISADAETFSWKSMLDFLQKNKKRLIDVLMSKGFYEICLEEYLKNASTEVFSKYLTSFRELYFSLLNPLSDEFPMADVYHALSTGYAGALASAASYAKKKPLILTEHGIYTREREEEIVRSEWISDEFKELWINFFKKLSMITYGQASLVTSLFESNKALQVELGCPASKIQVIPNGVDVRAFSDLESKNLLDKDAFHIGAILRVVPVKDVKTMLFAFDQVLASMPEAHLWIMGGFDEEPDYYEECVKLIESLHIGNVTFLGQVDIREYLPEMDLLVLSSISEGQPLGMLEGMAAAKPFVCTNAGDCKGLLEGKVGDELGRAGYVVPVMDSKAMADTILHCAKDSDKLARMGKTGQKRVETYYRSEDFLNRYKSIYALYGGKK